MIDGPFTETKELVAGFWLWKVKSMDEAVDWLKRAPFDGGTEVAFSLHAQSPLIHEAHPISAASVITPLPDPHGSHVPLADRDHTRQNLFDPTAGVEMHEPAELWYTTRPWYPKAKASGLTDADGYIIRWGVWSPDTLQVWSGLPVMLLPLQLVTPLVAPLDTVDLRPQVPPYRFERTVEDQIRLRGSLFQQVLEDPRLPEHATWIPGLVRQIAQEGSQRGVVGTEPTVAADRARVASIDGRFDAEVIEPELHVTLWFFLPADAGETQPD